MAAAILPSGPGEPPPRWSAEHLRLHRSLLRQPQLLPRGASLLLAVSGGQDSMAMLGLLRDLQPLHHWRLHLWHGDHGWRPESAEQAGALQAWAQARDLPIRVERQDAPPAESNREAAARLWRYACLRREAERLGCSHVLTAHTATDRAETVLLHLARGSHRRGLASLRRRMPLEALLQGLPGEPPPARDPSSIPGPDPSQGMTAGPARDRDAAAIAETLPAAGTALQRPAGLDDAPPVEVPAPPGETVLSATAVSSPKAVPSPRPVSSPRLVASAEAVPLRRTEAGPFSAAAAATLWLVRPLQLFSRQDTARLCRRQGWPVWEDPSNLQLQLSRNRIRAEVLPVLEALHPGACRRISDQAERLAAEQEQQQELLDLALLPLRIAPLQLDRRALLRLSPANRALLLQHWLRRSHGREIERRSLEALLPRLAMQRGAGRIDLAAGWRLCWRGTTLTLLPPDALPPGHG